jgi:DNA-binding response OmpR family regulator
MKILTVEDEVTLSESIQEYLRNESYECDSASSFQEGVKQIKANPYDCILLDITLGDGNGLRLLEQIKGLHKTPAVIIISAKNSLDDRVFGLNSGADDYLTKPFHLSELNARIKAVSRRKSHDVSDQLILANVTLDLPNHQAFTFDQPVNLTKKEFDILFFLAENKGRVVPKATLVQYIWDDKITGEDSFNFLFSHIKNIKRKLTDARAELSIRTVYGIGYQLLIQNKRSS